MLYRHRSREEAERFIHALVKHLNVEPGSMILDLACGKGRHSKALFDLGLRVTAVDLSPGSIHEALKMERDGLEFFVHDMRCPFRINYYHYIFNLFTSFGYFNSVRDEHKAIRSAAIGLQRGGKLVIDYFNAHVVRKLVVDNPECSDEFKGVLFNWKKTVENNRVIKTININDAGKISIFKESVRLLSLEDFKELLKNDFDMLEVFGDYQLNAFDVVQSPRLIMIAVKK
jgi:ubiquinone/menaquinone biosynthesis C-methylase UbiE